MKLRKLVSNIFTTSRRKEPPMLEITISRTLREKLRSLGPPIEAHLAAAVSAFCAAYRGKEATTELSSDATRPIALGEEQASTSISWALPRDCKVLLQQWAEAPENVIRAALRHYVDRLGVKATAPLHGETRTIPEPVAVTVASVVYDRIVAIARERDTSINSVFDDAFRAYLTQTELARNFPADLSFGDIRCEHDESLNAGSIEIKFHRLPGPIQRIPHPERIVRAALRAIVAGNKAVTAGVSSEPKSPGVFTEASPFAARGKPARLAAARPERSAPTKPKQPIPLHGGSASFVNPQLQGGNPHGK